MKRDIRILMINARFPPYFSGHAHFLIRLSKELIKKNFQVTVLAVGDGKAPREDEIDGIKVVRRGRGVDGRLRLFFILESLIFILLNGYKYDIYHIHGDPDSGVLARIIGKLYGKKVVNQSVLFDTDDPVAIRRRKFGFFRYFSFLLSDAYISISSPLTQRFIEKKLPLKKIYQIPTMVDCNIFYPVDEPDKKNIREKLLLNINKTIIVGVGSVIHRKGFDILLEAFRRVKNSYPDIFLMIVGPTTGVDDSDKFYSLLKEFIVNNGLVGDVVFTGQVDSSRQYLQASDIFVFPSRREGFSNVTLEAMAVGLPCIIANLDGVGEKDVFTVPMSGIVIKDDNPGAYAEALLQVLKDKKLRKVLGENALILANSKFSSNVVGSQYEQLYNGLLKKA